MKNHDEMYQSLLSRYNDYQEKKKKRIRAIKRTAPVLVCFCISVILIPMIRDDLAKLPSVQISPGNVDNLSKETAESPTTAYIADVTESRSTDRAISTDAVSTAVSSDNAKTGRNTATAANQTVTTAVSADNAGQGQEATEHRETVTPVTQTRPVTGVPVTTAPVTRTRPVTGISVTNAPVTQTRPVTGVPVMNAPVTQTRPVTGVPVTTAPVTRTRPVTGVPVTTAPVTRTRPVTEIQTTSLAQTTAKSPETTNKKTVTIFPPPMNSMETTIQLPMDIIETTIPHGGDSIETTIPQTTTAQVQTTTSLNNTYFDVDYTAVILNGICFWNTHEIITAEVDEDIILYYEKENTIHDIVENTTHIKTPEWGTRYYILNENEVVVEINRKWMVFRKH